MSFCITANISVIPGTSEEGNYSQGEYVTTNILLSGKKVGINLIYPCKIRGGLTPSGLRSAVDAFDPEMAQANYNLTPMNISGLKALWGELENNTLVIYQPANKSVATLFFEEGISSRMKLEFLGALKIELSSYSPENYCAQSMAEIMPVQEAGDRSPFNRSTNKEFEPDREAMLIGREISQEALMADQRAIQCQA